MPADGHLTNFQNKYLHSLRSKHKYITTQN